MAVTHEPRIGSEVAGCLIERLVGRGGMGVVYQAHQHQLDRRVAIKLIAPELTADATFHDRFGRESRAAAAIDHPHVIPVYGAGEDDGELYLIMRYVDGFDVRELLALEDCLNPVRAADITVQVASALDAAHDAGLIHRDVKPANILLDRRNGHEHAFLSDFGLTKAAESVSGPTKSGQWVGTIDYISPEQIDGAPGDARSDVYSLGCVLHEMLAGRPPFVRATDAARMWAHLNEAPPSIHEDRDDVPEALDSVIACALAKQPDDRFASAGEFGEAALAAAEGRTVKLPGRRPSRPSRRERRRLERSRAGAATVSSPPDTRIDEPEGDVISVRDERGKVKRAPAGTKPTRPWRLARGALRTALALLIVAALAAVGVFVAQRARESSDPDQARSALTSARTPVAQTATEAGAAEKLVDVRRVGAAAQRRLATVQSELDDARKIGKPAFRAPSAAALTAERDYLSALAELRTMGDRDLGRWKAIRPRLEVAQRRLTAARPRVLALDLGRPAALLPAVPAMSDATLSLDSLIRRAGVKLGRWERRVKRARAGVAAELASLETYQGTMNGMLDRYSTLRSELQALSDEIDGGTSYERAYTGLAQARQARVVLRDQMQGLQAPLASNPSHARIVGLLTESIAAIEDAAEGLATYQTDFEGEYAGYEDTEGWQRFQDTSARISEQYDAARADWQGATSGHIEDVRDRDMPPRPNV